MTLPQLSASFLYSNMYERSRDLIQTHLGITSSAAVSALAGLLPLLQRLLAEYTLEALCVEIS